MKVNLLQLILGLVVGAMVLLVIFSYMGTHMANGLCENKYTEALKGYKDYGEGVKYPAWLTDCCYDSDRALDICQAYADALGEDPGELCSDLSKDNPATLFDCTESDDLCNDENCVQSCDRDEICEKGEGPWCEDCW